MSKKKKNKYSKQTKDAFYYLQSNNYIFYDRLIPESVLYIALNIQNDDINKCMNWDYISGIINLKQYMETKGYKTSQRNGLKGLYILPVNKLGYKVKQRRERVFNQLDRDKQCIYNVDQDALSKRDKLELDHQLHVMSLLTQAMNSILKDIK